MLSPLLGSRHSRDRRGVRAAALLETLIVLPVMLTIAFNALEFSRYGQARMIVRYAQVQGMRECAVSGDHPNNPTGNAAGNAEALRVANAAIQVWRPWFASVTMPGCNVQSTAESAPVDFPITARYRCSYPLSFCRVAGGMNIAGVAPAELAMPMQTAFYDKQATGGGGGPTVCQAHERLNEVNLCVPLTESTDAGSGVVGDGQCLSNADYPACTECWNNCETMINQGCTDDTCAAYSNCKASCAQTYPYPNPPGQGGCTQAQRTACSAQCSNGGGGGAISSCIYGCVAACGG